MLGLAGRCGLAGHAVNPSMGARWRHPWRQRSCKPTPPTSDSSRRLIAVGRCRPWSTHPRHAWMRAKRSALTLTLTFLFFDFPWRTRTETVRGRAGWVRGGVRGMDAAAKPPWTGSRRPPRTPPRPAKPQPSSRASSTLRSRRHEGLSRWPSPWPRAPPAARPGSAPRCHAGRPARPTPVQWPRHARTPAPPAPARPMPAAMP